MPSGNGPSTSNAVWHRHGYAQRLGRKQRVPSRAREQPKPVGLVGEPARSPFANGWWARREHRQGRARPVQQHMLGVGLLAGVVVPPLSRLRPLVFGTGQGCRYAAAAATPGRILGRGLDREAAASAVQRDTTRPIHPGCSAAVTEIGPRMLRASLTLRACPWSRGHTRWPATLDRGMRRSTRRDRSRLEAGDRPRALSRSGKGSRPACTPGTVPVNLVPSSNRMSTSYCSGSWARSGAEARSRPSSTGPISAQGRVSKRAGRQRAAVLLDCDAGGGVKAGKSARPATGRRSATAPGCPVPRAARPPAHPRCGSALPGDADGGIHAPDARAVGADPPATRPSSGAAGSGSLRKGRGSARGPAAAIAPA